MSMGNSNHSPIRGATLAHMHLIKRKSDNNIHWKNEINWSNLKVSRLFACNVGQSQRHY